MRNRTDPGESPRPNPRSLLHVESVGLPDAPPLVLVHGFAASNHSWRKWRDDLARDHHLHLVELTGCGRAPAPRDAEYTPRAQAERLADFLRHLDASTPPILIGHSLGGAVVLLAATRLQDGSGHAGTDPVPFRALVVVSGAVFPQHFPRYIGLARRRVLGELLMALPPPAWAMRIGIRGIVHDPSTVDAAQVEGYRAPLTSRAHRRAIVRIARSLDPEGYAAEVDRYAELTAPLLALWGANDRVVPPTFAKRLAEMVPNGRSVLLPGVGHLPPEEAPRTSLAEVRRFMADLTDQV